MVSFSDLWNILEQSPSPLMDSGDEDRALSVIRAGKDLRKEDETQFWDDFITICSNEGLADLLGVSRDKIANWAPRIREYLEKLDTNHENSPDHDEESEMVPTGDNGAFTVPPTPTPSNQDPNLGSM